jgi:phosphopantothenoylcysteine synthetase/decarboxylase
MTSAARQFISPLSAATLSGQPVRDDLFSLTDEAAIGHIELSRGFSPRSKKSARPGSPGEAGSLNPRRNRAPGIPQL